MIFIVFYYATDALWDMRRLLKKKPIGFMRILVYVRIIVVQKYYDISECIRYNQLKTEYCTKSIELLFYLSFSSIRKKSDHSV